MHGCGLAPLPPVKVKGIRVGARSGSERVKVVNRHVTTHIVVHSDWPEGVYDALQGQQRSMPGKARRIDLAGAGAAVEEWIGTLGTGRFPAQAIQSLRANIVGMFDQSPVGEAGPVEVVAVGIRRESARRHWGRSHQQTAALVEILDPSFGILGPGRLA